MFVVFGAFFYNISVITINKTAFLIGRVVLVPILAKYYKVTKNKLFKKAAIIQQMEVL